jgi:Protein of unknown function (DUF2845)
MRASVATGILFLFVAVAGSGVARADTLRCGSKLVAPGETATEVLAKCGKPTSVTVIKEPIRARNAQGGGTRVVGETHVEIWRYERGSREFPALLKFEEGVLKVLEFEKS